MNKQVMIIFFLLSVAPNLFAQRLWDRSVSARDYAYVGGDTSVEHLRQLVLNTSDSIPDRGARDAAINILACNGGESQKDFLLSALQMAAPVDSLGSPLPSTLEWWDYWKYQAIRGYYGEAGAITGMDSIARFAPNSSIKLAAVANLAEARFFKPEYFHMLKSAFGGIVDFNRAEAAIADYGSDQQYRVQAGDVMESVIRDSSLAVARGGARYLAMFDKPRATALLQERFQSSTGMDRYLCFVTLRQIDSSGQASRSLWAIPREPDETMRLNYFPRYREYEAVTGEVVHFTPSAYYITPAFVNFTKDWLTHESSDFLVRQVKQRFLDVFIPSPPPPSESASQLLDTLVGTKEQVSTFNWLTDEAFLGELDGDLEHGSQSLQSGDSIGCAQAVKTFQDKVDVVYADSLNPDPRSVTVEGWKFLHYNAQYILDRLPQIPAVQEHILSVPSQYATIQSAVDASQPSDVIDVSPGNYGELVSINNKDSLTLRTTGGVDQVTVRGFHLQQSNVVTIKGFVVDAAGTTEHGIVMMGGNNQNTDVTIEACDIKNAGNDQSGILIARGNPRTRIVNNRIHDNGRNGILIIDATGGPHYVINNTIVLNGWNAVNVARQHVIYLVNNILSFNSTNSGSTGGRYGVLREAMTGPGEASGITLLNNLIVGNNGSMSSTSSEDLGNFAQTLDATDNGNYTTAGTEGSGVTAAPALTVTDVFISVTDLHLKSGSFAIDRGLSTYAPPDANAGAIPSVDYEGEARPKGAGVDLGADEKE